MNAEVLAILKDTLLCFEKLNYQTRDDQYQCSKWICNHIEYKNEVLKNPLYVMGDVAIDYIHINRPTETLFPEIFNGYGYDKTLQTDAFWYWAIHTDNNGESFSAADIQEEKIKYLKLLVSKLQSELDDNTTQIA